MPITVLSSSDHKIEDFDLDHETLPLLWKMEDKHFWHAARNEWILHALKRSRCSLPASFLEVGCGGGAVGRALVKAGYRYTGVDTAPILIEKAAERMPTANLVCGTIENLPAAFRGPYDVIGFFDVLEHLSEPEVFLRSALRWAHPGTLVIATVPALQSLYTMIDKLAGHKKRYEPQELQQLFRSVGLTETEEYGIFRCLLRLMRHHRSSMPTREGSISEEEKKRLQSNNVRIPSPLINLALKTLCAMERSLLFQSSLGKAGASLLAIGRVQ